jgi:DNA-binding NarL/FixJ family response regulator
MPNSYLTKREIEVCELLIMGKTNRQMATALGVSENTIEFHMRHIFEKFHAAHRTEAAIIYIREFRVTGATSGPLGRQLSWAG